MTTTPTMTTTITVALRWVLLQLNELNVNEYTNIYATHKFALAETSQKRREETRKNKEEVENDDDDHGKVQVENNNGTKKKLKENYSRKYSGSWK